MVAMSDTTNTLGSAAAFAASVTSGIQRNSYPLMRAASTFFGAVLIASSLGIWMVPGAAEDTAMLLFRMAISVTFMFAGLSLLSARRYDALPEVHLDAERGELRLVERGQDGIARITGRYPYVDLSSVVFHDGMLIARGHDGTAVLTLPVGAVDGQDRVEDTLRAALKQQTA